MITSQMASAWMAGLAEGFLRRGAAVLTMGMVALGAAASAAAGGTVAAPHAEIYGADFTWSPLAPGVGEEVAFTDTSTGSPSRWSWSFGDGSTSSLQNPSHTYATSGSKSVTLTVTTPLGSSTTTKTVEVQGGAAQECVSSSETLCLLGERFRVEVDWHDQYQDRSGAGKAIPSTDRTGFVWFFDRNNVELVVKVLDGRSLNGHYWVFYGALSDVEYWITITDTKTGRVKTYHNPAYNICGIGDTEAFASAKGLSTSSTAGEATLADWERGGWLAELIRFDPSLQRRVGGGRVSERAGGPEGRLSRTDPGPHGVDPAPGRRLPVRLPTSAGQRARSTDGAPKTSSISVLYCEYLGSPLSRYHGANPVVWVFLYSVDESRFLTEGDEFTFKYAASTSSLRIEAPDGEYELWIAVDSDGDGYPVGPFDLFWRNYRTLPSSADHWFARIIPLTAPVSSYERYEWGSCSNDGVTLPAGETTVSWGRHPESVALESSSIWRYQKSCSSSVDESQEVTVPADALSGTVDLWGGAEALIGLTQRGASSIYGEPIVIGVSMTYFSSGESNYFDRWARVRTEAGQTAPTAVFSFSPAAPNVGQTVQFTDESPGDPTAWSWSFGDGGTSTKRNPTHAYSTPGPKMVTLTVSNAYGSDSETQEVAVQSNAQTTCGNAYYDDGTGEGAFFFGGGQAGDPNFMYAVFFELDDFGYVPGQVEITGFCAGNSRAFSGGPWPNEVFIYPDAGGRPDDSEIIGRGTIVTGDGTGDSVVTLASPVLLTGDFWLVNRGDPKHEGEDFNMEHDGGPGVGHSYLSTGGIAGLEPMESVNMILRATLREASSPAPVADFEYSPLQPKVGQKVTFTDRSAGDPTSWKWSFGDGSTSTQRNPSHTFTTTGNKNVKLTVSNASGSDSVTKTINVRDFDPCVPGARTLCLAGGRFEVEVRWHSQYSDENGVGHAVVGTDKTGYMWFFSSDNIELLVKILDGRSLNGHYWVFYGALSDVEYWIDVTDMSTGTTRTYYNAPYGICGAADTEAF